MNGNEWRRRLSAAKVRRAPKYNAHFEATRSYCCICPEDRADEPLVERFMDWITASSRVEFAVWAQPQE